VPTRRGVQEGQQNVPLAKIHVLEGQYDEARLTKVSGAIQNALIEVLGIPRDDFFQIHHVLPRDRYFHTPAFLGQRYSDDMILLELTFIIGRPRETRLALLKSLNEKVVAAARISPDDLVVMVYEIAGENASFGSGLAQRAHIATQS
jgi:Tautomerase enzyme